MYYDKRQKWYKVVIHADVEEAYRPIYEQIDVHKEFLETGHFSFGPPFSHLFPIVMDIGHSVEVEWDRTHFSANIQFL
jgi:hypothetical protein